MIDLGDRRAGVTLRFPFNTNAIAGESITVATNGTVRVYKDGGLTQSTTGATFSEDFDGVTGTQLAIIDTSADGTFYSEGSDFLVMFQGATIDGKAISAWVGSFSLANRASLMPTTAGRKLDVSSGGEAGIDWANVGSPTTTLALTNTTAKLVAASFGVATLDGTFVFQDADVVAAKVGDLVLAAHTDPGSLGLALQDIEIAALATNSAVDTEIATILAAVDSEMAAVKAKTDQLVFTTANRVDSQVYGMQPSVLTAAAINTDAITASKIASGAIDADALAADAGTEIGTAVWASTTRLLTAGTNIVLAKGTGVTGFNDLSAAQVNAEVLDVLVTDTFAEPGAVPAATASLKDKIGYTAMKARNKRDQTATTARVYADNNTTVVASSAVTDDGTTTTIAKDA